MKAKQKAKELYSKYYNRIEHTLSEEYSPHEIDLVKQCALIAVDEILASHYKVLTGIHPTTYDYFIEVKKELENL